MSDALDLDDTAPKHVPYSRFQEVAADRKQLRARVAELELAASTSSAKLAQVETLTTQLEQLRGELTSKTSAWEEERSLIRVGLTDPDDIDLARLFHAKTPVEGRKPLGDWYADLKADPTKAPRALAAILSPATAPAPVAPVASGTTATTTDAAGTAPVAQAGQGTQGTGIASTTSGTKPGGQAAASEPLSAEKLREIRERCSASGDWTEWRKANGKA